MRQAAEEWIPQAYGNIEEGCRPRLPSSRRRARAARRLGNRAAAVPPGAGSNSDICASRGSGKIDRLAASELLLRKLESVAAVQFDCTRPLLSSKRRRRAHSAVFKAMDRQHNTEAQLEAARKRLSQLEAALATSQQQIVRLLNLIAKQQDRSDLQQSSIARLDRTLMELLTGRTWRALRSVGEFAKKIAPARSGGGASHTNSHGDKASYLAWIQDFERPTDELMELKLPSLENRPLISIVMPVFNTAPAELTAAIESVLAQSYKHWELCIADDASPSPDIRPLLERFAQTDARIKLTFQAERGGISKTANAAWQLTAGRYVAFLDHDDTLAPHALAYVCETLDRSPEADLIYSDEDKLDAKGRRFDPFFKPDWSPDLLLSENYICHLLILRQDLVQKIGSFHSDCDGSQDYDLILRATEHAAQIEHIPKVLYHWRAGAESTASNLSNKQYTLHAAQQALERYCERSGKQMRVEPNQIAGRWRMRYVVPPESRVSIIIASGGKADVLRTNLTTLFARTTYRDFEVIVIDNSKANAIEKLAADFASGPSTIRYIDWRNKPFNYSAINNAAAKQCESPVLLFLNDDTSVIAPDWLGSMVELVMRPEVGAAGAKLLYPNGRIQHAGVVMGLYDNCGHAFKALDGSTAHYFDFSDIIRNVSAVTGACLMARAEVFWQVGGFDETDFAVAFNDVDLCLKIGALGLRVLYTPHALLYHHEAFSKTSKDLVPHPEEVTRMRYKWEHLIATDPYYSPNLTRNDEHYSLKTRR